MAETTTARRVLAPPSLHVAFPGQLSRDLRLLAAARGDRPAVLVQAIVAKAVGDGLVDAVLDGEAPAEASGGHGRRALDAVPEGLTLLQCGALYIIGFHRDDTGWLRMSAARMARLLGRGSASGLAEAMPVLVARGLAESSTALKGAARCWRLTPRGEAAFLELEER